MSQNHKKLFDALGKNNWKLETDGVKGRILMASGTVMGVICKYEYRDGVYHIDGHSFANPEDASEYILDEYTNSLQ